MKNRVLATAGILTLLLLAEGAWVWAFRSDPVEASRNSAGTMSGLSGPYTAGTVINSATINSRLADIETEITNSLDRSARGGMLAATRGIDGTVSAPAFSWTSETGSGWYRIGASDLGLAISGSKKLELTSTLFTVTPNVAFSGFVSGNLGIGAAATYPLDVLSQVGSTTARFFPSGTFGVSIVNSSLPFAGIAYNATHDGANWKYLSTNSATTLNHDTGTAGFSVYSAPSGTAGNNVTFTKRLTVNESGVTIGASGTAISASIRGASSFTPGAVAGQTCAAIAAVTTTGAVANSECSQSITVVTAGLAYFCKVTADTCTVYACNVTAGSVTPASNNYGCRVFNN